MIDCVHCDYSFNNNRGFSLVELVLCIAIVAIATIPLMNAFSTSGIVIGKAQSVQNATSAAESVMEEVKGSTVNQLKDNPDYKYATDSLTYSAFMSMTDEEKVDYGATKAAGSKCALIKESDGFYVIYRSGIETGGESFNAITTLDADGIYSVTPTVTPTPGEISKVSDASDANSIKLPVIEKIDKGNHAVLSKEINRFDASAAETWRNNYRDANHLARDASVSSLTKIKKEVLITIDDPITSSDSADHKANIECEVRYYDGSKSQYSLDPFAFSEKVYSGSFLGSLDTRAYVFYQTAKQSIHVTHKKRGEAACPSDENIIKDEYVKITSTSVQLRSYARQVYFILQEDSVYPSGEGEDYYVLKKSGTSGTNLSIDAVTSSGNTLVKENDDAGLDSFGVIETPDKKLRVITNIPKKKGGNTHFYYNEESDHIYYVEVFVYDKNKDEIVRLKSTKDAE